ncbi:putative serine/threonine-protein kinase At1g54610 isoform X2 [Wolffia australiana]
MGCICSKGTQEEERSEVRRQKSLSKSVRPLAGASRREEIAIPEIEASPIVNDVPARTRQAQKPQENAVAPPARHGVEKKAERPRNLVAHQRRATVDFGINEQDRHPKVSPVPNGVEGELVAAGWPNWLVSVAGEAVRGWVPRKAESFEKLDKIGQGTYSTVFRARDLETGKMVALKKVRFVNMDPESVRFMAREILILRRLDHPNIIKLKDLVASRVSCSLYLVFEYMEHDLAGLAAAPGVKFTEPQIKCYMKQLLSGLEHCHGRGVLHRDIKGSNLLMDNKGVLKIADFGLATFFNPTKQQPLTSRVVTLWYRPPELLLGATVYGVAVDLWSAGCILAELLAGKPIMPGRTEVEQLHKIYKLCGSPPEDYWQRSKLPHSTIFKPQHPYRRSFDDTFRDFPPSALSLLNILLSFEPEYRGTAKSALNSEFFTTRPHACDPSSLPKYPPCKEYDAKLRDEEQRRQRAAAAAAKDQASETESQPRKRASNALPPTFEENPDPLTRRAQPNRKSSSDKYSGQLIFPGGHGYGPNRSTTAAAQKPRAPNPPEMPNFAVARGAAKSDNHRERTRHPPWPEHASRCNGPECSDKPEWPSTSYQKEEKKEKRPTTGYGGGRKSRMHYSGPLMPPGINMEDMLKEHERQIQQAVRKARLDKAKTKKGFGEKGQLESLLNGRSDASDA